MGRCSLVVVGLVVVGLVVVGLVVVGLIVVGLVVVGFVVVGLIVLVKKFLKYLKGSSVLGMENDSWVDVVVDNGSLGSA